VTDLADQTLLDTAPAGAPAAEGADIENKIQEAIKAANAAVEERIKGFQTLLNQRDTNIRGLTEQLEQVRLSSLDEDERTAELERREQAELERLRAENELLRLGPEYSRELPLFQRLIAAPTAKDQLDLIRELMTPTTPANLTPAAGNAPAPVDPNNPASGTPGGGVFLEGAPMDDDLAERVLRSVSRMR
jgi:hypothetical protein